MQDSSYAHAAQVRPHRHTTAQRAPLQARHSHVHGDLYGSGYPDETRMLAQLGVHVATKKLAYLLLALCHRKAAATEAKLDFPFLAPHHADWIHGLMTIPILCTKTEVSMSAVEMQSLKLHLFYVALKHMHESCFW